LATPRLQVYYLRVFVGRLAGKTQIAGAPGRGVHRRSTGELDGIVQLHQLGEDWRETYIDFIKDQKLPAGITEKSAAVAHIRRRSKGFVLVGDKQYKHGARSGILMKCVTGGDGYDILHEIHDRSCGNHAASKTLGGKAYRAGFWWPTVVVDVVDLVPRYPNCQFFGKQ
jgi:hypothetical protein